MRSYQGFPKAFCTINCAFLLSLGLFLQFTVQLPAAFKTVNLINLFYRPIVWSKSHQPAECDNKINLRHLHHEVKLLMRILLTSKLMMPQWARDVIKHHQESEGSQLYWFTTMAIDILEINLLREQLRAKTVMHLKWALLLWSGISSTSLVSFHIENYCN